MNYVSRVAQVDEAKCAGCKTCERHCPTGAMKVREEGKAGYVSPCITACPAGINVPGYIALAGAGDYENAYRLIRSENPFPSVCGRICTHECQSACNRAEFDNSVAIRDIKRFVADKSYNGEFVAETPQKKNGRKIAIIGAGPSGLTCAYYMALSGYTVDVFESEKVAGGVLYFGIPEYRLPKAVLARDIKVIEDAGVKIHLNTVVGEDVLFDDLRKDYHAVYIATGTQFSKHANIPGEDMPGVYHGLDFLRAVNLGEKPVIGKKVVVIGGGNTAVDAARTAVRMGAESVKILYRRRRTDMPAERAELLEAFEEGIRVIELSAPVEIKGSGKVEKIKCVKTAVADYDEKGRRKTKPVEGSEFEVEADTVIVAVSQYSDLPFIDKDEVLSNQFGQFVLDEKGMTSMHGVFAGGDVVRGSVTAIEAINDGKVAAININDYLGTQGIIYKSDEINIPKVKAQLDPVGATKRNNLSYTTRINNDDEVALGLTEEQLKTECSRCLMCEGVVSVNENMCYDCALCWELCPHEVVHMKHLPQSKVIMPKPSGSDRFDQIVDICTRSYLRPMEQVCQCTTVTAEEVVGAILDGARTLQELYIATGVGGGCGGGYCGTNVYRLFEEAGYPIAEPGDDSHYKITQCLGSLPKEAGDFDPSLKFEEQQQLQWNDEYIKNGVEMYRKAVEERSTK